MNILLIAYYFDQPGSGGTERARGLSRHFQEAGHRVTVVTSGYRQDRREGPKRIVLDPGRNNDRRGANYFRWLARRLLVEARLRCGLYASVFSPWRRRVEREAAGILAEAAPDVILATYPPIENLAIGMLLHKRGGAPLVADFRDGLAFEPVERRAFGFRAVRRRYREMEALLAREAAAIVTVSPPLSRHFREELGCRRVATIANGYDVIPPLQALEPDPLAPGGFHVVHTGGISESDRRCDLAPWLKGVEMALAADPSKRGRLRLHFAGRLSRREKRLLRPLVEAGIARVYGPLPRANALWLQRRADLLLLLTATDRTSVATAKLFEYMQAQKPVLAMAAGTFAAEVIAETGIGWAIPAGSPRDAAAALAAIMEGRQPPPAPMAEAIARYDRRAQSHAYISLLREANR